jgi:FkbM family methyltransferase
VIKQLVKKTFRRAGYQVSAYDFKSDPVAVRMKYLASLGIDLVFDVGANEGQYASQLRKLGFAGRMVSFEPLSGVYQKLAGRAAGDPRWEAVNCALGNCDGCAEINVSQNTWSSSLLDMLPGHLESAPESAYQGKEQITVRSIDSIIDSYQRPGERLFLKIDTQGFGMKVLQGAEKSLQRIQGIHMEMSLVPLYQDEPLLGELASYLHGKGYALVYIEPEYLNPLTGQQLQVNGLFLKGV